MQFSVNGVEIANRIAAMYQKRMANEPSGTNLAAAIIEIVLFVFVVVFFHVFINIIFQSILIYVMWAVVLTPLFGIAKATLLQCVVLWWTVNTCAQSIFSIRKANA